MSTYARSRVSIRLSSDENFGRIQDAALTTEYADTPTGKHEGEQSVATGGTSIKLPLTTVHKLYIENRDTTNYVTVTLTRLSTGTTMALKVTDDCPLLLNDVDPATAISIVANTAACVVYVFAIGLK